MSKKYLPHLATVIALSLFAPVTAASEEQCVARYDSTRNIAHIPCVTIGAEKIWANLRLVPSEHTFAVDGSGKNFLPLWLMQKIDNFIAGSIDRPMTIRQFEYQDAVVYHFASQCCDQFNYLYDTIGNVICAPDGGISGRGDGKCSDFAKTSIAGSIIWEDKKE